MKQVPQQLENWWWIQSKNVQKHFATNSYKHWCAMSGKSIHPSATFFFHTFGCSKNNILQLCSLNLTCFFLKIKLKNLYNFLSVMFHLPTSKTFRKRWLLSMSIDFPFSLTASSLTRGPIVMFVVAISSLIASEIESFSGRTNSCRRNKNFKIKCGKFSNILIVNCPLMGCVVLTISKKNSKWVKKDLF